MPTIHNLFIDLYTFVLRTKTFRRPAAERIFAKVYFLYKRYIEDPFTPLIRRRPDLFGGGHILDVGANLGYTAVLFAGELTGSSRVYAFEPEEWNFKMLQMSIAEGHLESKILPVRAAVGAREGEAELWLNPGHHADHRIMTPAFGGEPGRTRRTQQVPLFRLDYFCDREILNQPIRFIKIDVQGYEECVCQGMVETLEKNPEAVVGIEYWPHGIRRLGFKAETILQFFEGKGYCVGYLRRRGGLRAVRYQDIAGLLRPKGYIDLLFSKSDKIFRSPLPCA